MPVDLKAFEHITGPIIASAIAVHKAVGAGLLEKAYSPFLHLELQERGLRFKTQQPLTVSYKGVLLDMAYRVR